MKLAQFLTLSLLFTALAAIAQTRTALVMGVGSYDGASYKGRTIVDLPGITTVDLPQMAKKLQSLGFSVTVVADPTLGEAKTAVDAFSARIKAAPGVSLFYFSGHGGEYEGKNYLIPRKASISSKADLTDEALSAQRVLNGMEESGAQVNLVFLDCCRDDLGKSVGGAEMSPLRARGSFIGFATRSGDSADPEEHGSPYTRFLLQHLDKPGVSVADMYGYVIRDVKDYTKKRLGEERRPGFYSELEGDPFYFVPVKLTTSAMTDAEIERRAEEKARALAARMVPSTPTAPSATKGFTNTLGMAFVPVPGTQVQFCVHETRVADFAAFVADSGSYDYSSGEEPYTLDTDGWKQRSGFSWKKPGFPQTDDHPVTCVSWEDAQAFCKWLSRKEGRTYRLPTDHEWSMAAGIGSREDASASPESKDAKIEAVYPWGGDFPPTSVVGNYAGSEAKTSTWPSNFSIIEGYRDGHTRTAPVMSFTVNKLGIHDLGGNLWEWCDDWYNAKQEYRVLRGGSWNYYSASNLLSSNRDDVQPGNRLDDRGFRLVLVVGSGG